MAYLNKARLVNITYGSNRKYTDVLFDLNKENALSLLQNSGGKSVTCKFLLFPFVWGKRQNQEQKADKWYDDNFKGPSYIGLDFDLNETENMTIMAFIYRNSSDIKEKGAFVTVYKKDDGDKYDINNFPLKTSDGKVRVPREINKESLKNPSTKCFSNLFGKKYSDYASFLQSYNININFYSDIMPAIIESESGISDVFSEKKTLTSLIKDFILNNIILNKNTNDEAMNLTDMLTQTCESLTNIIKEQKAHEKDIKKLSNLEKTTGILLELEETVIKKEEKDGKLKEDKESLTSLFNQIKELKNKINDELLELQEELRLKEEEIQGLKYEKDSYAIICNKRKLDKKQQEKEKIEIELAVTEKEINEIQNNINYFYAYKSKSQIDELQSQKNDIEIQLKPEIDKQKELEEKLQNMGEKIYASYRDKRIELKDECENLEIYNNKLKHEIVLIKERNQRLQYNITSIDKDISNFETNIAVISSKMEEYNKKYLSLFNIKSIAYSVSEQESINEYIAELNIRIKKAQEDIENLRKISEQCVNKLEELNEEEETLNNKNQALSNEKIILQANIKIIEKEKNNLISQLLACGFKEDEIQDFSDIKKESQIIIERNKKQINKIIYDIANLSRYIDRLKNRKVKIDDSLKTLLDKNNIDYKDGLNYLIEFNTNEEERKNLVNKIPIIINSVILTQRDFDKLFSIENKVLSETATPIIIKEFLDNVIINKYIPHINSKDIIIYCGKPDNIYNPDFFEVEITKKQEELDNKINIKNEIEKQNENLTILLSSVNNFISNYGNINKLEEIKNSIIEKDYKIQKIDNRRQEITKLKIKNNQKIIEIQKQENYVIDKKKELEEEFITLSSIDIKKYVLSIKHKHEKLEMKRTFKVEIEENLNLIDDKRQKISNNENKKGELTEKINTYKKYQTDYIDYKNEKIFNNLNLNSIIEQYKRTSDAAKSNATYYMLKARKKDIVKKLEEEKNNFKKYAIIPEVNYIGKDWSGFNISEKQIEVQEKGKKQGELISDKKHSEDNIKSLQDIIDSQIKNIKENYHKEYKSIVEEIDFNKEINALRVKKEKLNIKANKLNTDFNLINRFINGNKNSKYHIFNGVYKKEIVFSIDNYESIYMEIKNMIEQEEEFIRDFNKKIKNIIEKLAFVDNPSLYNGIKKNFNDGYLTYFQVKSCQDKTQGRIDSIKNSLIRINSEKEQIFVNTQNIADRLVEELKNLHKVAKRNKIIEGGKERNLVKFDFISDTHPQELKSFLDNIIELIRNKSLRDDEIFDEVQKQITLWTILQSYISTETIKLKVSTKEKFGWRDLKYDDFIKNKLSGAQKMISSLALIHTFKEFELFDANIGNRENTPCFILQDNPFAHIQTDEYVNTFFELANIYKIQFWNWADTSSTNIIAKHKTVFQIKIKQKNNKEYVIIENPEEENQVHTMMIVPNKKE